MRFDLGERLPSSAIVRRELVANLRRPRSFLYLVVFAALAIAYIMWAYPDRYIPVSRAADLSEEMLQKITGFFYLSCFLLIPGLAGGSITTERETDTFDFLHLSLIGPAGIFLSKLANAVGLYLVLLIGLLPALGATFFLVGVDWVQLLFLFLTVVLVAISSGAIGVACSALFQKSFIAITASYLAVISIQGVGLGMVYAVSLMALNFMKYIGLNAPRLQIYFLFAADLVYCVLMVVICLVSALAILRKPPPQPVRVPAKTAPPPPADTWLRRSLRRALDRVARLGTFQNNLNPIWVKEIRLWTAGRPMDLNVVIGYFAFALFLSTAFGYLLPAVFRADDFRDPRQMIGSPILIHMVLVALIAPLFTSHSLAKEVEIGNLDMLRLTLQTPFQIVMGNFYFGLTLIAPTWLLSAIICAPLAVLAFPSLAGVTSLVAALASLALVVFLVIALSLLASVLVRKTMTSILLAYVFNLAAFGGIAGTVLVLREVGLPLGEQWGWFCSPLTAMFYNIHKFPADSLFNGYWLMNIAVFGAAALGLTGLAIHLFGSRRMRDV